MAAVTKEKLFELLAHQNTRQALGRLAQGEDLRRVAADVAGQALASKLGQMFGAAPAAVEVGAPKAGAGRSDNPEPIDAEFVTINVTEQSKKSAR